MRLRTALPLALSALLMVVWLSLRMWCGNAEPVWMFSCLFGAWAPIMAAAFFLYIRAIGDREDTVLVAWLVRALGMHCILVWMLGFSDWLRGPPAGIHHWDSDIGAPIALFAFVPAFGVSLALLHWVGSIAQRIAPAFLRPARPGERDGRVIPFRGLFFVRDGAPLAKRPLPALFVATLSLSLAIHLDLPSIALVPAVACVLALATLRNHRAIPVSLVALCGVTLSQIAHYPARTTTAFVTHTFVWPWLALGAIALYLAMLEALVRTRSR